MQFVDECNLTIKAGDGGDGIVSWRREAHYPEGGPWGGEAGDGANVIIIGDLNFNSLFHLRFVKNISAENGQNGQNKLSSGKKGENVYVRVPVGTQILDKQNKKLIVDILSHGQEYVIAKGGKGGHGNAFFKSSLNKAPTLYEHGDKGEYVEITMKLKYIADVGLVGLPNVGKSSLISSLSNAKPKIANYPFTTLIPVLGTINYEKDKSLIMADIPGLIEGASENKGLGFEFLKHIERCSILLHVVSLNAEDHENGIVNSYKIINSELKKYDNMLTKKLHIIVANKIDVPGAEEQLKLFKKSVKNKQIIAISAKDKINLDELKDVIIDLHKSFVKQQLLLAKENEVKVIEVKQNKEFSREFTFERLDEHRWQVTSKYLSYWLYKIPQNTKDNIYRFKQKMNNCNIDATLIKAGAKSKDTFLVDNIEFELD